MGKRNPIRNLPEKLGKKTTTLSQKRNKKAIWEKVNAGQLLVNKLSTMFNGWFVKRERSYC